MNASPVPTPTTARAATASPASGAASASALPVESTTSAAAPERAGPKRSLALPPGIWITRWVATIAVLSSPMVASPTPYERDSSDAMPPMLPKFHPLVAPSRQPATTPRRSLISDHPYLEAHPPRRPRQPVAAHQRVGRRCHRLEACDRLAPGREELRIRRSLEELDLYATLAAL